jgi:hypothetical protein
MGKRKQLLRSRKRWSCYWLLLAAIHDAGLVSLTHTPSPMNFISKILNRPKMKNLFTYPSWLSAAECWVPI